MIRLNMVEMKVLSFALFLFIGGVNAFDMPSCTYPSKDSYTFKYVVTVMRQETPTSDAYPACLGSLVNDNFQQVLTPCSCIGKKPWKEYLVVAGDRNLHYHPERGSKGRQSRGIVGWDPHPQCDRRKGFLTFWSHDFALLTTSAPFIRSRTVDTLLVLGDAYEYKEYSDFFTSEELTPCNQCVTIGRKTIGYNHEGNFFNEFTEILDTELVSVKNDKWCGQFWCYKRNGKSQEIIAPECVGKNVEEEHFNASNMFCSIGNSYGHPENKMMLCDGDRGAPIVCQGYIIGILQWYGSREACGDPLYPYQFGEFHAAVDFINPLPDFLKSKPKG